jgi:hypothetical protein
VRADLCESRGARRGLRALPTRRRPVVRTINPDPIIHSLAQSFPNRIHQDVASFLFQFVMIAQAVIEEIALPIHAMFSSNELFPVLDGRCPSWFARKCHDRVQMVWHKQAETAVPDESLVIESHSGEHSLAEIRATQLVFAWRHAVDGDKEPTTLGDPLWNCMR